MGVTFKTDDLYAFLSSIACDEQFSRAAVDTAAWLANNNFNAGFGAESEKPITQARYCFKVLLSDHNGPFTADVPIVVSSDSIEKSCRNALHRARKARTPELSASQRKAISTKRQKKIRDFTEVADNMVSA